MMSGNLPSKIGQSFVPKISLPSIPVVCWGAAQGYHAAPVRVGPVPSADTSKNRTPAAWVIVATKQNAAANTKLDRHTVAPWHGNSELSINRWHRRPQTQSNR